MNNDEKLEKEFSPEFRAMRVLIYYIEPCSKVNRQGFKNFPRVLQIETVISAGLALVANDCERYIRCLISRSINRENLVIRVDSRNFRRDKKPSPQNIAIIDRPAGVKLNTVRKDASVDPSRQAGEDKIAFIIWCKQN